MGRAVKGARVLMLGVAYKADVSDVRESPALYIIDGLRRKGADVVYNDPHVAKLQLESGEEMSSVALTDTELQAADCAVVVTAHSSYEWERIAHNCTQIVDTRNALRRCD